MGRIAKFMENELDRVNDYLSMAHSNLIVISELCEDRCKKITPNLSHIDEHVVKYLENKLSLLDAKITTAKEIIDDFKDFFYESEAIK